MPDHTCSQESWIREVSETANSAHTRLDGHASANGEGKGHVTRREFDKLEVLVEDIRRTAMRVLVGVLVVSAGGSALGPTIKTAIIGLFQ